MAIKKKPVKKVAKKAAKTKKKPAKKAAKIKKKPVKKPVKKAAKKAAKTTTLLARIAEHRKELEKAKNKAEKSGEKLFKQAVKEIFANFPELASFSWSQYTPHWNDGDQCVFECHFDSIEMSFSDGSVDVDDVWGLQHLSELLSGNIEEKKKEIASKISVAKEEWEKNSLKSNLQELNKSPEEIQRIHKMYSIKKSIVDLLEGIDASVYENLFGEGSVQVTKDDMTVSECEHD
jgi:hypothetical protein